VCRHVCLVLLLVVVASMLIPGLIGTAFTLLF
jgi:hypothetical protein